MLLVSCRADEEVLADAFEALVGAVYLDSGIEAASRFLIGLAEVSAVCTLLQLSCTEHCQSAFTKPAACQPQTWHCVYAHCMSKQVECPKHQQGCRLTMTVQVVPCSDSTIATAFMACCHYTTYKGCCGIWVGFSLLLSAACMSFT